MSLASRIRRLEQSRPALPSVDGCPRPAFGAVYANDEPEPDPADVRPCPNCAGRHVQHIIEIVVSRDARGVSVEEHPRTARPA